jgi:hypothetical protein
LTLSSGDGGNFVNVVNFAAAARERAAARALPPAMCDRLFLELYRRHLLTLESLSAFSGRGLSLLQFSALGGVDARWTSEISNGGFEMVTALDATMAVRLRTQDVAQMAQALPRS